jgi:hypothetical protein
MKRLWGRRDRAGQDNVEQEITETIRTGMLANDVFSGRPEHIASLLLTCAGPYRDHPSTPAIVRGIAWASSEGASPDLRTKLCLAIIRLAEPGAKRPDSPAEEVAGHRLQFTEELDLRASHAGPQGSVSVTHRSTAAVVAHYDFSTAGLSLNEDLAKEGSGFPPALIGDAIQLALVYVGQLTAKKAVQ